MEIRKTKVICTLGPAVDSTEQIRQLIRAGMNGARFNFSHGSHASHLETLNRLRTVRDSMGAPVATILDTKGPEIRIRTFAQGSVTLENGAEFILTTRSVAGDEHIVSVTYDRLNEEVTPGTKILIDDGLIGLEVRDIRGQDIYCTVVNGGPLSNHKSINIPGVAIHLPALTEKDEEDIRFGVEQDFDYIAASFVRKAEDVRAIRAVLHKYGGDSVKIVSKIENQEGVDNLEEILAESDGIMVARGDLGVEIPAAQVPVQQKRMIKAAVQQGKLVIIATQMLDSMIRNPRPTRAEVSDVANAVFDGADCVMLSGETASGKFPVEAVKTMTSIVSQAEASIDYWHRFQNRYGKVSGIGTQNAISDAITHTCCLTAMDLDAKAIVTATASGHTARLISRFRPACGVVAITLREKTRRQMNLFWGVVPCLTGEVSSTDRIFSLCAETAVKEHLVQAGDRIIITAGVPLGATGYTNLLKAHIVLEDEAL
ncbi:MAG: pyruvate kinase [Clostridiales bacterium]|nr:pyruvate kinase [Clostridiales bacterium]